ncbi:MAG TPA: GAF domain-containing protein, partial [Terriglobales bacterium]|nr:GAF domain-containing protein [Terriglobales bacterium]
MTSHTTGDEDDPFQAFLLEFSTAAANAVSSAEVLKIFCSCTRAYFQVSGAYVWHFSPPDQLTGAEADGWMAERFRHSRLHLSESAVATEAIRQKRPVYVNRLDTSRYFMAAQFQARAMLAVPLVVSNEVVGAAVLLHRSEPDFFTADHAAKASIVAAQLGGFLEVLRLSELAREGQRRAGILAEVAHSLHSEPDLGVLVEAVADRVRALLRTPLVCILVRESTGYDLWAVATEHPAMAVSVRARYERKDLHIASDLAHRAVMAGETISAAIDPRSLGDMVPPGMLLASPFRTSSKEGAVLVYPRREGPFSAEEKALLPVVTSFAAVAISNAELYSRARAQAQELHEIVNIASELGFVADLDQFMRKFVFRACAFLGFQRAIVALLEDELRIRWTSSGNQHGPNGYLVPEGILTRAVRNKEVLCTEDATQLAGANQKILAAFNVRQLLAVPLLGPSGQPLGLLGVLDRVDGAPISQEDIRRAKALAAQVAVALEVSRNLLLSEQHRRKATALTGLALEMRLLLRGGGAGHGFLARAAEMMEARSAALVIEDGASTTAVLLPADDPGNRKSQQEKLARAVIAFLSAHPDAIVPAKAEDALGSELAGELGWKDLVLARLQGSGGELLGALCFADRSQPLGDEDGQLLRAIVGQASVSLENGRFFTRMEQANRHWIEIFDAIPDFIVAHDQSGNVLRVNRALADFIGVQPQQLIGLNMGALLATGGSPVTRSCPFCRSVGTDEYMHPVLERNYLVSTSEVHAA